MSLAPFSAIFPDYTSAQAFVDGVVRSGGSSAELGRANLSGFGGLDMFTDMATVAGGHVVRSSRRREQLVYQYQDAVTLADRRYLATRDPTAVYVLERPAIDTWFAPPRAFGNPAVERFIGDIYTKGFQQAVIAADIAARRDGGAFLYINASGDASQPIGPRDQVFGFDYIQCDQIPSRDAIHLDVNADPLLSQHGIERIEFYPTTEHKKRGELVTVHGSRIISMREDVSVRWWQGRSVLDPIYDDLWNYRDVIFSQKQSQFMGNPIKVEVDWEAGFDIDDDEADTVKERISQLRSGHRDSISPIQGLKVTRLGAPELDDPEAIVRALASRIANGTVFPVNMILASSRGSEQVTDQDYITYESEVDKRRRTFSHSILAHMFRLWQVMGAVPRRAQFPLELRWKHLRVLNEREEALAIGNMAKTLGAARSAGFMPPEWFVHEFTPITEPIDTDTILPRRTVVDAVETQVDGGSASADSANSLSFCMDHLDRSEGIAEGCRDCGVSE